MRFSGKRVLVTGGARGIGKGIAQKLLSEGATVIVLDKDLQGVSTEHPGTQFVHVDLSDCEATKKAVDAVLPVDFLINNAGITTGEKILEAQPETIDNLISVNVKGAYNVTQRVAGDILGRNARGAVVNICSPMAHRVRKGKSLYSMTKSALFSLTKSMALEFAPNIRVNSVSPSTVLTDMMIYKFPDEQSKVEYLKNVPLGRMVEAEDVANAVCFLLSDDARMITGSDIVVDGGRSLVY